MQHMAQTERWTLDRILNTAIFKITRTTVPYSEPEQVLTDLEVISKVFKRVDLSRMCVLVDLRAGPMRNNPEFEQKVASFQRQMLASFRRAAVLVATPVGKMQLNRLIRESKLPGAVFDDEKAALEFLNER